MQIVRKSFISLILSCKVRKNTALLLCTTNRAGTEHKLHFLPKHPARAKLAAINNKKWLWHGWMFGLKMELMACADLVGGTKEKSCLFPGLIWYYKSYETLSKYLHYTSAVPQPFFLLIAANLALAVFLGWKWSLWHVPAWLAVQNIKAIFFLALHVSINDMKHFRTFCITPQPCHSHFCCWLLPIWT